MTEEGQEKIRRTAKRLRESGIWVSARTVYDALGRKGSYNAMAAVVADWKAETEYRPEIECHDLPVALKVRLLDIGSEILGQVRAEQAATLDVERSNAEARRRAYEAETAEATAMVEQLLGRVNDLQAEVAHLRALNGIDGAHAPNVGLADVSMVPTDEAERSWKQVEADIHTLLAERGAMWAPDILAALPPETRQLSAKVGLPLSVGWLGYHLRRMAEAGEGIRVDDGRFALAEPGLGGSDTISERIRFWGVIMGQTVAIINRAGRPMTPAEITSEFDPDIHETALSFGEPMPGWLTRRMQVRARRENEPQFVELDDGRFDLTDSMKAWRPEA